MRQQIELVDREFSLYDNCERLQVVRNKIKTLEVEEKALVQAIIADIGHEHKGSRTYEVGTYKVECKTPVTLTLDKKAYANGSVYLPEAFDPIEHSVSYTVNRGKYLSMLELAPESVRDAIHALIVEKDGKPNVVIKS